ncbi:hypothetical protein WBP_0951 [Wolbachia endosymbiont of Brugia pahangi]|nr:hypothetical protein WBP_0951 [Wolbachia endosymbiont of Brugia pahangi]
MCNMLIGENNDQQQNRINKANTIMEEYETLITILVKSKNLSI